MRFFKQMQRLLLAVWKTQQRADDNNLLGELAAFQRNSQRKIPSKIISRDWFLEWCACQWRSSCTSHEYSNTLTSTSHLLELILPILIPLEALKNGEKFRELLFKASFMLLWYSLQAAKWEAVPVALVDCLYFLLFQYCFLEYSYGCFCGGR